MASPAVDVPTKLANWLRMLSRGHGRESDDHDVISVAVGALPANVAAMGWEERRHGWDTAVSELIASAETLRAELLRVAEEPRPMSDLPARRAAQAAVEVFSGHVARLPRTRGRRRTRKLAALWENAAAMAHFHHRAVFADAEQLGFALLTQVLERGVPRGQRWQAFRDAATHAEQQLGRELYASGEMAAVLRAAKAVTANQASGNDIALAAAVQAFHDADADEPAPPATRPRSRRRVDRHDRGPIADQTELRYRMRVDLQEVHLEAALASTATSREARRRYQPWLEQTLQQLTASLPVADLELVAAEWRQRRGPDRPNPSWADVIIVEPIPRKPATRRWRRRHGDEPPPPLAAGDLP
jgi:hypothetical protein